MDQNARLDHILKPKRRKKGGNIPKREHRLIAHANYLVNCLHCGFTYEGSKPTCPKCGTKKGELI